MITATRYEDYEKVLARDSERSDGPFFCPECRNDVVLKKGAVKVPHFAHKPPVMCEYGRGESEQHRACKQAIYDALKYSPDLTYCELEMSLGPVRPDIYFESGGVKCAIEVQISHLSMDKIISRTRHYDRLGIYVLWLALPDANLAGDIYSPKQWEKWLHATYYGRVYYWLYGLTIRPVHFGSYQLLVPPTDFGGGYFKTSKRYRTPMVGPMLNLLEDFQASRRSAWSGGDITVPPCRILTDTKPVWWKKG